MLELLLSHEEWQRFLDFKLASGHLSKREEKALTAFIKSKDYLPVAERLNAGGFFSVPEAVRINKSSTDKKRTVFIFDENENIATCSPFSKQYLLNFQYDGIVIC